MNYINFFNFFSWIYTLIIDQNYRKQECKETLVQTLGDDAQANRLCIEIYEQFLLGPGKDFPLLTASLQNQ